MLVTDGGHYETCEGLGMFFYVGKLEGTGMLNIFLFDLEKQMMVKHSTVINYFCI